MSEHGLRGTGSVSRGAPMGRPEGADLFTAQNTGVPNVTFYVLIHSGWDFRVNMPSALANTRLQNPLRCTLFSFRNGQSGILLDPLGTPPKSLYESHAWCLLNTEREREIDLSARVVRESSIAKAMLVNAVGSA